MSDFAEVVLFLPKVSPDPVDKDAYYALINSPHIPGLRPTGIDGRGATRGEPCPEVEERRCTQVRQLTRKQKPVRERMVHIISFRGMVGADKCEYIGYHHARVPELGA